MRLTVELISGKVCTLEVPPDTTIRELKEKLKAGLFKEQCLKICLKLFKDMFKDMFQDVSRYMFQDSHACRAQARDSAAAE